jgi:hypothetical protein
VNYLHPGLKRGKMTPQEERLVLELHSKWGNRFEGIPKNIRFTIFNPCIILSGVFVPMMVI